MDLRQLAALVAVADHGTFSAAATALHTVQSNVSTHVARLERELGVTLVDRAGGGLTDEGAAVVERARRIQHELQAAVADVAALGSEIRGAVRLGMLGTTGRWLVPRLIDALAEQHPFIELTVAEGTSANIEPRLGSGVLDLAILTLPVTSSDVTATDLFDEDLLLVTPVGSRLAELAQVEVADLAGEPLLLPARGTVFRSDLERDAAQAGVALSVRAELDGVRLLASLAFEGFASAVVPASAVPRWLTGPFVTRSIDGLTRRRIGLASRARTVPSAPAQAVADALVGAVEAEVGEQTGVYRPGG